MGMTVLDISVSLDGFIADANDDPTRVHDWLFNGDTPSRHSDFFKLSKESAVVFDRLIETTGSIVTGRRTYDLTAGWGGSHPVNDNVFVVSNRAPGEIPAGPTRFTFVSDGIGSAVDKAKSAAGGKKVYVLGGAGVAQQCLKAGLLDEIMLHLVPVLLGSGIRLFADTPADLRLIETVPAPGVTHLRYRIIRQAEPDR